MGHYSNLETQGFAPKTPAHDLRFAASYNLSFEHAKKSGETQAYFQSASLDAECAMAINDVIYKANGNLDAAADDILIKYGKDRAERVVAAFANRDPDKYPDFKAWAARKGKILQAESSVRNKDDFRYESFVFVYGGDKTFARFLQKFQDVADSMKYVLYTRPNDMHFMDWAFPRELARESLHEAIHDKKLSFKEKMAAAKQNVREQELNPLTRKRKSYDHDL